MARRPRFTIALGTFATLLAAVAHAGVPAKTEVLPGDGGELGKAYLDLAAAMKAGDKQRAGRLLDPRQWHLANKQKSWFDMFADMESNQPAGGRIQGDRATLFLVAKGGNPLEFRYLSAARTGGGWQFDSPATLGSSFSKAEARDCGTSRAFPCGTRTAPDSVVAGTITPRSPAPDTPASYRVIDGLAVRLVDDKKQPVGTSVLLSIHGVNPDALALSGDPEEVKGWLGWPVIRMDIAPGGKSAKLEYYNGASRETAEIAKGLSIEAGSPDRIRGQLKGEIEGVVFDLSFDLGTGSSCQVDQYRCGPDPAP
jgi:hypothetical protein